MRSFCRYGEGKLLDFDLGASFLEFGSDLLGLVLGNRFLERLRSGFDKILGLLETETGEFADDLDDADLLRGIETGEDHVKLGLLFFGGSGSGSRSRGGNRDRSRSAHAETLFQSLDQLGKLHFQLCLCRR